MAEIKNYNYVTIQGWMINHLNLKGSELIVYALINGLSQGDNQWCSVSYNYMSDWIGSTRRTAMNIVNSLEEKGLIKKEIYKIDEVSYCKYKTVVPDLEGSEKNSLGVVKNLHQGSEKISPEVVKKFHRGSEKFSPNNNIYNNINNNNNIYIGDKSPETPAPESKKRFVKPTVDEIAAYISEKGYTISAEKFFNYYESNGWKVGKNPMKNWKSAVSNWQNSDYNNNNKVCGGNNTKSYESNW